MAEQSANSAGQQALMHAKAMDSIESKWQQFKVAWQEFVSNLSNSQLFKGVLSVATKFLNLFNTGIKPVNLMAAAVALLGSKIREMANAIKSQLSDKFGGIKNFFTVLTTNSSESALSGLRDEINQLDSKIGPLRQKLEQTNLTQKERKIIEQEINNLIDQRKKKQEQENQLLEVSKQK